MAWPWELFDSHSHVIDTFVYFVFAASVFCLSWVPTFYLLLDLARPLSVSGL